MATDAKILPFEHTPLEHIPDQVAEVRQTYQSYKTRDLEWRLKQLRKMWWGLNDYAPKFKAALKKDLNKPPIDANMSEISYCIQDLNCALKNLTKWAKDERDLDYPVTFAALKPRIKKEPIGTALLIGPYNFPLMLCLAPLIGVISAGCTAIIKPSEGAPATAMVIQELVENYLDTSAFKVVQGAIPETTALLDEKWDKIFYTGSPGVARIIYKAAAKNLTPVVLELGGRNPAFISRSTNLPLAARRLMWGKCINAGQVCLSQNYVLVDKHLVQDFVKCLNAVYHEFFPKGPKSTDDYGRIINERQFDRIKKMLDETKGKIVMGGETDRDDLYISPTVVLVDSIDDPMIQQESFGPIWSILPYDTLDNAIKSANTIDPTPLSLMTFGSKEENEKILSRVTSGGATINDSYMHASIPTLPFGGVGESGTGAYHGKASYDTFTHRRTIVEVPSWMEKLLRARYVPYDTAAVARLEWMNSMKPNFDRNGNEIKGLRYWSWVILGLGGPSAKGALLRWLVALAASYAVLQLGGIPAAWRPAGLL
jgi:beta-apo-4'-carotenal oxygenase